MWYGRWSPTICADPDECVWSIADIVISTDEFRGSAVSRIANGEWPGET